MASNQAGNLDLTGRVGGQVRTFRSLEELAALLRGRAKRDLIASMVVRSPSAEATEKLIRALDPYPLVFLLLAAEYPARIWLLDRGEKVSSAEILTAEMRRRRWHSTGIGVDDCEGLTDIGPGYLAMVSSWRTLLVLRHEFAHVVTTFFTLDERAGLSQLFARSHAAGRFMEPLARESLGEYLACALTYTFFADLDDELARFDAPLHRFVRRLRARADDLSATLLDWSPAPVSAPGLLFAELDAYT